MIIFPNAKINIGLKIVEKRQDGYHNIETVFYPLYHLCDLLEYNIHSKNEFTTSGIRINSSPEDNLCIKAYHLLKKDYDIPPLRIHLHKIIPIGAGLGGGSADAAVFLKSLNDYFHLGISLKKMEEYVAQIGSDCAFFIRNIPAFASGRGEILTPVDLLLNHWNLFVVYPGIHISSKEAYSGVVPKIPVQSLLTLITSPVKKWKDQIINDFEISVFEKYPEIKKIKETLYNAGAIYASMSGSGSTVYGIFKRDRTIKTLTSLNHYFVREIPLT